MKPCPPQHLITDDSNTRNPENYAWVHQDQLILNALIGSIHHTIIPFIAQATTSQEAWKILASTYATPSRGHIKQQCLAPLEIFLEELGDDYKELVCVVQARDTSITFDERHEKLLMFEASLHALTKAPLQFSPTANEATGRLEYRSQTS
ncbi:hypothetical protein POTOM_057909 [Populus tomentosa]|uniref:Uncharacterized protein n=1 Tax=Populus tomentosa TaxID=118781 RepID=A0A8X7XQK7_POPTO|nr:hypothetical protein POTOM_057909 [Populus tomentosa]